MGLRHSEGSTFPLDKRRRWLERRLHTLQEDKERQFLEGKHALLDIYQQFCLQSQPVWKEPSCLRQKDSDNQQHNGLWKL